MKRKELSAYFAKIGSKGGKTSRRTLTTEQSKAMLAAREAKRAEKLKRTAGRSNQSRTRGRWHGRGDGSVIGTYLFHAQDEKPARVLYSFCIDETKRRGLLVTVQ